MNEYLPDEESLKKILAEAKKENLKDGIADFVKNADGRVRFSDIAVHFGVPTPVVMALCQELIREGTLGARRQQKEDSS